MSSDRLAGDPPPRGYADRVRTEAGGDPARTTAGDPARTTAGDPARTTAGDPARTTAGDPARTTAGGNRGRTKAEQREATTAALITAARELFAHRGYAAVGTEEIVQQAGVTRGALYHHFKDGKEELFRAVLVQISAESVRQIAKAAQSTDDPWEALSRGCDAFLDVAANPEVQRIMLIDGPAVLGWDVWRAIDADYGLGVIERALQHAIDAGVALPASTDAVARVLTGALDEAAMVVARADDPDAARDEMGRTVHRLLDGLRGPGPP